MSNVLENIKLETKYYKIEKLLKWDKRQLVDEMLLTHVSCPAVAKWCKEQGFDISKGKMYDYKEDLKKLVEEVKMKERERIINILTKNNTIGIYSYKDINTMNQIMEINND